MKKYPKLGPKWQKCVHKCCVHKPDCRHWAWRKSGSAAFLEDCHLFIAGATKKTNAGMYGGVVDPATECLGGFCYNTTQSGNAVPLKLFEIRRIGLSRNTSLKRTAVDRA